jgi:hypothetical protein
MSNASTVAARQRMKIIQPFRNPSEYQCFLEGVKRTADLFGMKVDSRAWGDGIPIDLTLYQPEEVPEPVVRAYVEGKSVAVEVVEDKPVKKKTKKKASGKSNARAQ